MDSICLWREFDARRTIVDGVTALRNILTWQIYTCHEVHLMQAEALELAGLIDELRDVRTCPAEACPKQRTISFAGRLRRFDITNGDTRGLAVKVRRTADMTKPFIAPPVCRPEPELRNPAEFQKPPGVPWKNKEDQHIGAVLAES